MSFAKGPSQWAAIAHEQTVCCPKQPPERSNRVQHNDLPVQICQEGMPAQQVVDLNSVFPETQIVILGCKEPGCQIGQRRAGNLARFSVNVSTRPFPDTPSRLALVKTLVLPQDFDLTHFGRRLLFEYIQHLL